MKTIKNQFKFIFGAICLSAFSFTAAAQSSGQTNGTLISSEFKGPRPTMLFLAITPDARASSMGDLGVATEADANAIYWNPGKLINTTQSSGFSVSYTPWLRNLGITDMALYNLSGYKKLGPNQAFGLSLLYFDLGTFANTSNTGQLIGNFSSAEYAITGAYSRKLSEFLSLGINLRYINSNFAGNASSTATKPAQTVSSDVGINYVKPSSKNWTNSYGIMISNISGKVSYGSATKNFIPTNLRLGFTRSKDLGSGNKFTYGADLNKLLVPTSSNESSAISGIFSSLFESPESITLSLGTEYTFSNLLAIRAGYFNESKNTGNRKYISSGLGVKIDNKYNIDFAYLISANGSTNPLANTIRISLLGNFGN